MAEGVLFGVASELLSKIASQAFKSAYKRGQMICGAKDELHKLETSIQTIQAVLLDAEKGHGDSDAVKNWVKRVREVLYDAEDLFDEIETADLFKKNMKGKKPLRKVRTFFSDLNPVGFRSMIAEKVKAIRKSLNDISTDMSQFQFVHHLYEEPISSTGGRRETGSHVDLENVIGRDEDKKTILDFLLDEPCADKNISVIATVGIGGIGKTTLAQLVYNHEEVKKKFKKRWWACISDVTEDKEVIGRIFQSITEGSHDNLLMNQLESGIRDHISKSGKFLLILDDVWDENRDKWLHRMSLFKNDTKGSKIIVTTRSSSVARAMGAVITHPLGGLSEVESWELFKKLAFTEEQKDDSNWTSLGKEIVKKCSNVPLAITSIASLLYTKTTVEEWESFKNDELSKIDTISNDKSIMSVLKLSYDHLPSNLKQCFAYCSLFPKDYKIHKMMLIHLWISQGYVKPNSENQAVEEVGHASFMELLRRSFFQEVKEETRGIEYYQMHERIGGIEYCQMHDLVHDLAQFVAGDGNTILHIQSRQFSNNTRHIAVGDHVGDSWRIPPQLLNVNSLRSCLFMDFGSLSPLVFDELLTKFKLLRALDLRRLGIKEVSSSIGELKHLRYLVLSCNNFKYLPDSITKLLNLISLDISRCSQLEALPNDFRKLSNLRHLYNSQCRSLRYMPPGIGELTSLQYLTEFKIGKLDCDGCEKISGLDTLARLMLKGDLSIVFNHGINNWDRDECWQLPVTVRTLKIFNYAGMIIPSWANGRADMPSLTHNIVLLRLCGCERVKHLPPFKRLPKLKVLMLQKMNELEYVEEHEEQMEWKQGDTAMAANSTGLFFPSLKSLDLDCLPKLKGWSRKIEATTRGNVIVTEQASSHQFPLFPLLSHLKIKECPKLKCMPLSPQLEILVLDTVHTEELIQQQLASTCSQYSSPSTTLLLHFLRYIRINNCDGLISFPSEALTTLQHLGISNCSKLKKVCLPPKHLNVIKELEIERCPQLQRIGEDKRGLDWSCFPNLRKLWLTGVLPQLQSFSGEALTSLRDLHIIDFNKLKKVQFPPRHLNVLERLEISRCPELELCVGWESLSILRELRLEDLPQLEDLQGDALITLRYLYISRCNKLKKVYFPTARLSVLESLVIQDCPALEWKGEEKGADWDSFPHVRRLVFVDSPELENFAAKNMKSLRSLVISKCNNLKKVYLPPNLEKLQFGDCSQLKLWEEENNGVDWDSLPNLRKLELFGMPKPERLPDCLQQRKADDKLEILYGTMRILSFSTW